MKKFCAHRETSRSNLNLEYPQEEQRKQLDQQEDEEAGYGAAGVVEGQWSGLGAVGGVEGRGGAEGQWMGLGAVGRAGAHQERQDPGGVGTRGIPRTKKRAKGNGRASGTWRSLGKTRAAAELQKHLHILPTPGAGDTALGLKFQDPC